MGFQDFVDRKAAPIVAHRQHHARLEKFQAHRGVRGARVPPHVVQSFLPDAKQHRFDLGRQAAFRADRFKRHGEFRAFGVLVREPTQCRHQAHIVEHRRAQIGNELAQVFNRAHRHVFQFRDLILRALRVLRHRLLDAAQAHAERGEPLPGLVVQFARDAFALFLLRRHRAFEQFTAQFFLFLHLLVQPRVFQRDAQLPRERLDHGIVGKRGAVREAERANRFILRAERHGDERRVRRQIRFIRQLTRVERAPPGVLRTRLLRRRQLHPQPHAPRANRQRALAGIEEVDRRADHRIEQSHHLGQKVVEDLRHVERRAEQAAGFKHDGQFALGFLLRVKARAVGGVEAAHVLHLEHAQHPDHEKCQRGDRQNAKDLNRHAGQREEIFTVQEIRRKNRRGRVNHLIEQSVPRERERRAHQVPPELGHPFAQKRAALRQHRRRRKERGRHAEKIIRPHFAQFDP